MADDGYTFAEYRKDKQRKELDKSFDVFEDDLSREEYGAVIRDYKSTAPGPIGTDTATVNYSNDKRELREIHESRSERAQAADESQLATVTTDPTKWREDPDDFDFPGVDTPSGTDLTDIL